MALFAVVYWASDSGDNNDNNSKNNGNRSNSSPGRDGGGLLASARGGSPGRVSPPLPLRTRSDTAAATSSATPSGEEGEDSVEGVPADAALGGAVHPAAVGAAARRAGDSGRIMPRQLSEELSHHSSASHTSDEHETGVRDGDSSRSIVFDGNNGGRQGPAGSPSVAVDRSRSTLGWRGASMAESFTTTATASTTVTSSPRGWGRCFGTVWEKSGRFVLALRRVMSSKADPWVVSVQYDSRPRTAGR